MGIHKIAPKLHNSPTVLKLHSQMSYQLNCSVYAMSTRATCQQAAQRKEDSNVKTQQASGMVLRYILPRYRWGHRDIQIYSECGPPPGPYYSGNGRYLMTAGLVSRQDWFPTSGQFFSCKVDPLLVLQVELTYSLMDCVLFTYSLQCIMSHVLYERHMYEGSEAKKDPKRVIWSHVEETDEIDIGGCNRHKSEMADGGAKFLAKMRKADKKAAELHPEKERSNHETEQLHEQLWRGTEESQFYKREAEYLSMEYEKLHLHSELDKLCTLE